jgi:hypothetical protein
MAIITNGIPMPVNVTSLQVRSAGGRLSLTSAADAWPGSGPTASRGR